jgi:hypothetical protein
MVNIILINKVWKVTKLKIYKAVVKHFNKRVELS